MGYNRGNVWSVSNFTGAALIISGIRIAVVTVIGIATVAAFIDAGGLGTIILRESIKNYTEKILVGGILTASLATLFDVALSNVEKALLPWQRANVEQDVDVD